MTGWIETFPQTSRPDLANVFQLYVCGNDGRTTVSGPAAWNFVVTDRRQALTVGTVDGTVA